MTRINPLSIALSGSIIFCAAFAMLLPAAARAADCAQWDINGHWEMRQSNGYTVTMDLVQTGKEVQGTASYSTKGGTGIGATFGIRQSGPVTGTVNGNSIQLRTSWGADYTGGVGSDAFFGGGTRDPKGSEVASWRSDRAATCLVAEGKIQGLGKKGFPPPAGKIQGLVPPPAGKNLWLGKQKFKTATAANDVNIHDGPGGNFNIMKCPGGYEGNCIMRKDDTAPILDFHPDGWYQLKLNVPGGSGWVAEDHLTLDVK